MYSIYVIKNTCSGRVYVGSTVSARRRKKTHFSHLRKGIHKNRRLQRDFNKFGESIFEFTELTTALDQESAFKFEQIFMDGYQGIYNILPKAGKARGRVHIKSTKDKMSAKAKGRVLSEEQKDTLRKMQLGRKASEETLKKRAETMRQLREKGEIKNKSTLNEDQVLSILKALDLGFDRTFLAEVYGVTYSGIGHIAQGLTWKPVQRKYRELKKGASA